MGFRAGQEVREKSRIPRNSIPGPFSPLHAAAQYIRKCGIIRAHKKSTALLAQIATRLAHSEQFYTKFYRNRRKNVVSTEIHLRR